MSEDAPASISSPAPSVMPWPLSAVWLGDHLSRDYARFWSRMADVSDPVQAVRVGADLGVNLYSDWAMAMGQMWLLPLKVWTASAVPAEQADTKTVS